MRNIQWTNESCIEDVLYSEIDLKTKYIFVIKCLNEQEIQILSLDLVKEVINVYKEHPLFNKTVEDCFYKTIDILKLTDNVTKLDSLIYELQTILTDYKHVVFENAKVIEKLSGESLRLNWHLVTKKDRALYLCNTLRVVINAANAQTSYNSIIQSLEIVEYNKAFTVLENFILLKNPSFQIDLFNLQTLNNEKEIQNS